MIIFLYGADSYRSKQKLNEIVNRYKTSGKSGFNLLSVDAKEIEFGEFYQNLRVVSMFAEKKLAVVKNAFSNTKFQEDFLANVKALESLQDVVVMYETEADKRLKLFKTLTKECQSQEFELLGGAPLKHWFQKELEKRSQKINADALDLLVRYVGNDLWRAASEIQKLADFKQGAAIKKEDVALQVRAALDVDIFKTIDALAAKNKPQAFLLMQKHVDAGDHPLYLLSMMAYQFKNLLVVKELAEKGLMYDSIVKKSGLHPFVVKKNYFACRQFSLEELKNIYRHIFQIDSDIKVGKIEPETAVDLLISSI